MQPRRPQCGKSTSVDGRDGSVGTTRFPSSHFQRSCSFFQRAWRELSGQDIPLGLQMGRRLPFGIPHLRRPA
jgi:hypothetical protein